ncbi:MAG TPA: glycosyltransferase [Acidimicrobiales bacterium]|nr:glycosyltransferase [Acidimicrobiales bacterium]
MTDAAWKVVFDLQATQSTAHAERGVARYVKEHVRALLRRGVGEAMVLNPHLPFPRRLDQDLLTSPKLQWNTQSVLRSVAESAGGPLAYFLMSPFEMSLRAEGDVPPHALRGSMPVLTTLYDLIPFRMADRPPWNDEKLLRRYRGRVETFHHLDLILTISEHTRRDAIELLGLDPNRLVSIGAGVSPYFRPEQPGDASAAVVARERPTLTKPYVFCQSGGAPHKNTERLLEAWSRLPGDVRAAHQLVVHCALDPGTRDVWNRRAEALGVTDDVVFSDYVPEHVLRAMYQRAELTIVPSLYEGFGFPAAESMRCGTPVITSRTSSLPEIVDWADATFDPEDPDAIAAAITRGLTDDAFRDQLSAQGAARAPLFTWDAVAQRTIDAMARVLGPAPADRTTLPYRIALVGPMPPTESGIADYNARLVPALARHAEVDLFTPGARPPQPVADGVRWFPPRALKETTSPWAYDAVVYTVGNSDDHHDLYDLAQEFPGVLWMHDVRLPGLYLTYARDRLPDGLGDDFLRDRLLRQYRRRLPLHLDWTTGAVPTDWGEYGLGLSKELVDVARAVVVSSHTAARLLALDQQPDARPIPEVEVLPLAAPSILRGRAPARRSLVCFGMVAPVKAPELLISALASIDDATLTFVGPVGDGYRQHLEAHAAAAGVADRVTITGRIEHDEYERWLRTGSLALQLRHETNGESSAAVLDCLAAGLPVVTNLPAAAELPGGTVQTVAWDIDAVGLAAAITSLLDDDEALEALGQRGQAYAASWTFDDVAARLVSVLRALVPARP